MSKVSMVGCLVENMKSKYVRLSHISRGVLAKTLICIFLRLRIMLLLTVFIQNEQLTLKLCDRMSNFINVEVKEALVRIYVWSILVLVFICLFF